MAGGLPVGPDRIITGTSATAAYTAEHHPGRPLFVLAAADALREFDGQQLLPPDEADAAPPGTVAAVVIGDAGDDLSYRNLDLAFRLIRCRRRVPGMHRNPWWLTPRGETLDSGAFVVGLEFATGRPAPRRSASPRRSCSARRPPVSRRTSASALPGDDIAMVGDDPVADVRAAQRVGLRGFLVLTGKTTEAEAARLMERRGGRQPPARGPPPRRRRSLAGRRRRRARLTATSRLPDQPEGTHR